MILPGWEQKFKDKRERERAVTSFLAVNPN
jgi:hypothetical protein